MGVIQIPGKERGDSRGAGCRLGQVWVGHMAQRISRTSELLMGHVLWQVSFATYTTGLQSSVVGRGIQKVWWHCTLNLHWKPWPLRGLCEQGVKLWPSAGNKELRRGAVRELPNGSVLRGVSSLMCQGSQNPAQEERFSLAEEIHGAFSSAAWRLQCLWEEGWLSPGRSEPNSHCL